VRADEPCTARGKAGQLQGAAPPLRFTGAAVGEGHIVRVDEVAHGLEVFDFAPLTSPAVGHLLYELALSPNVLDVLELGTAHGTSTAYLAAALDTKGEGHLTTIDRPEVLEREPTVHEVLRHLGLENRVLAIQARSYNRVLMRMLEEQTFDDTVEPCLDFCFLDGAHTWETDGLAFLLVDRLLRPGRWVVLDDVAWSLGSSVALRNSERVRGLTKEERDEPQVQKIVDLLIRTDPGYEVRLLGNIALAFKGPPNAPEFQRLASAAKALVRELATCRPSAGDAAGAS
jgi:predicted O-methyltransferase YrrM